MTGMKTGTKVGEWFIVEWDESLGSFLVGPVAEALQNNFNAWNEGRKVGRVTQVIHPSLEVCLDYVRVMKGRMEERKGEGGKTVGP